MLIESTYVTQQQGISKNSDMIYKRYLPLITTIWLFTVQDIIAGKVSRHCIENVNITSKMNLSCPVFTDRIEVLTVIYFNDEKQSDPCELPKTDKCTARFNQGRDLRTTTVYTSCFSSQGACSPLINVPTNSMGCEPFNFFFMEYACTQENEIIDLCGDIKITINSSTHLAYFPPINNNLTQKCTCVIKGGYHTLRAVDVGIPQTTEIESCVSASLRIKWNRTVNGSPMYKDTEIFTNGSLTNENIVNNSDITWINYARDCISLTPPVWFKILPDNGSNPTIYCGKSVTNTSSMKTTSTGRPTSVRTNNNLTTTSMLALQINVTNSSETLSNTTTISQTDMTSSRMTNVMTPQSEMTTEENQTKSTSTPTKTTTKAKAIPQNLEKAKLAVILGSTIGGVALLIIILALFIIYCRRQRRHKNQVSQNNLNTEESNTVTYENIPEGGVQLFNNHTFMESGRDPTIDYDHLGDVTTTTQQGKTSGSDNLHVNDPSNTNLYDRSLNTEYDHIQSVPTVQPRNIHQDQIPEDTYNQLYQGYKNVPPGDVKLADEGRGMEKSATSTQSEQPAAALYFEIPDSADFIHRPKEQSSNSRNSSTYSVDDKIEATCKKNSTDVRKQPFYHVLEKQPDSTLGFENQLPQSKKKIRLEDAAAEDNHEQMEFVNIDLYQSVDDMNSNESHRYMNNDTREDVEFVNNDLYQSADDMNNHESNRDINHDTREDIEFVNNDLYQSADDMNHHEGNGEINRDSGKGKEFLDNDLYQSADEI